MLQTLQFPAFSQLLQKSAKGLLTGVGPVFKSRPSLGDDLPDGRDLSGFWTDGKRFCFCGFMALCQELQRVLKRLLTGVGPVFKSRPSLGDDLPDGRNLSGFWTDGKRLCFCGFLALCRELQRVRKRVLTEFGRPHICRPLLRRSTG